MSLPEILGHDALLAELWAALREDRLHHALLLEGPDGVGRALVAQRLALWSTCARLGVGGATPTPCGACDGCARVLAGTHPDVLWVRPDPSTASRQLSVAAVREVIRLATLHRFQAPRRFVIIDPAEAMAAGAANALLKTLEEPPADTHFLLIARHAQGLLPTIVSRCQRVRCAPVPADVLEAWLGARGLPDAALVARLSEGCPGRALGWAEGALEARRAAQDGLLAALGADLDGVLAYAEQQVAGSRAETRAGVDELLELLEDLLRDTTMVGAGRPDAVREPDLAAVHQAWAAALWPGGVGSVMAAIHDARAQLAANVAGRSVLEALLTRVATELGAARKAARTA